MRFGFCIFGLLYCFNAFAGMERGGIIDTAVKRSARITTALPMKISAPSNNITTNDTNFVDKKEPDIDPELKAKIEQKEKEHSVCLANNIGISNAFVWAARNSDTSNYIRMVEDTTDVTNNSCFVKVQLSSSEDNVDLMDVPAKYFEMGSTITCGNWVDSEDLEKRILDAKKTNRVLGAVATAVGGAAVGVGAMELFGNKLIGGKVEGQKSLSQKELLRSQILVLKKSNETEYKRVMDALNDMEEVCNNNILWNGNNKPVDCDPERNPFLGVRDLL